MANTQSQLKTALQLHQKGDLQGAEVHYKQVLCDDPNNYTALTNVASIYMNHGLWQKAEQSLKWASLVSDANAEVAYKLGVCLQHQGKLDDAIAAYSQALEKKANFPEVYSNLGVALKASGQVKEAILAYKQAVALKPKYPEAHYNLGSAFLLLGNFEEAVNAFQEAITLNPSYYEPLSKLGIIYYQQDKLIDAAVAFQEALKLQPDNPGTLSNLGSVLHKQGQYEESITLFKQALTLKPDYPIANNNLGLAYHKLEKYDEAIRFYKLALQYQPNYPEAYYYMGATLYIQGKFPEAVNAYKQAILLRPNYAEARLSLAIVLLLIGCYDEGWKEYEWRFQAKPELNKILALEKWDGTVKETPELIIVEEQGIGDLIQFLRYGKSLKESFPRVTIAAQEKLCPLIKMTGIFDEVYALPLNQLTVPQGTKWISIMSVPGMLNVGTKTAFVDASYLKTDEDKVNYWNGKLHTSPELVVGLNWQGNPQTEKDDFKGRSFALSKYDVLATIDGIEFVSLQKGFGSEQMETCSFRERFVDCQDEINETWNWVETAAIIQACDLIITSDTSIAHLAGAMGKPTWILLKKIPDWRWGFEGKECSWYPSVRLFRQRKDGDWDEVMQLVKTELETFIQARHELI